MEQDLLVGLAAIFVLGVGAQWLASLVRLPSILLLLLAGFLAGPVAGWLRPGELIGEALPAAVSLAVAIILFDGGLSLQFSEVREVRKVVRRLISVGALVTLVVGTVAARLLLPFGWRLSLLLAAILVVSGPTVILPLLRYIRPRGNAGSVVKWEGIFIDPIGAVLAVLIFEVILAGGSSEGFGIAVLTGILRTALVGGLLGVGVAFVMVFVLDRFLVPHHLEVPVMLMMVVATYGGANLAQPESGLLAVTILGVALANQRRVPISHIVEFGETVGVLLTSVLFVVLSADLELEQFTGIGWGIVVFVVVLVVVARPLAVAVSTLRSELTRQERLFVAWIAPRGIVAASVASVFGIRLSAAGIADAELLIPYVFTAIVGTALVYGLTAGPVARRLGVADPDPQGVVILGAHGWAREIAATLEDAGFTALLVPTNRGDLSRSRLAGHAVHPGAILKEDALEHLDLSGIGSMVALTHNEEFNSLAALRFQDVLGRQHVFQLPADREPGEDKEVTQELRGRLAFGSGITFQTLDERFASGGEMKKTNLTAEFGFEEMCSQYEGAVTALFVVRGGRLHVVSDDGPEPEAGDTVIALVEGRSREHHEVAEDEGVEELSSP